VRAEPSAVEVTPTAALGYPDHLNRARQLARDDPKAIAGLVRNWVAANE
jgi:flagellar M-ring protein FliF